MMYLVNTLAVGATAVELRNLAIDETNNKVEFNGHGFENGDILRADLAGNTTKAGLTQDKMYVVDSKTANDFKLKTFKAEDATGDGTVTLSNADIDMTSAMGGGWQGNGQHLGPALATTGNPTAATLKRAAQGITLKKYGSKKCLVADSVATEDKVTCSAATTFKKTDKLMVYCADATGDKCKIDGQGNTDLDNLSEVWAREEDETSFTVAKAAPTNGTAAAKIVINQNAHADTKAAKPWLLSVDSGYIYPVAPKTLGADGAKWDTAAKQGYCGGTCPFVNARNVYFTQTGTPSTGLENQQVYHVALMTTWKFDLFAVKGANYGGLEKKDEVSIAPTVAGKDNTFLKIKRYGSRRITNSTAADNKLRLEQKLAPYPSHAGPSFVPDEKVVFYCLDRVTTDACKYNLAGGVHGAEFKIKATWDGTDWCFLTLKAATGSDASEIVVSDDATKTDGFMLALEGDPILFPKDGQNANGGGATTTTTTSGGSGSGGSAGSGSGSAARSFALLGSAFAMATAFLLA